MGGRLVTAAVHKDTAIAPLTSNSNCQLKPAAVDKQQADRTRKIETGITV